MPLKHFCLIAADNPGSFLDDTPTAKLVRQVPGAISEFEKAMTVAKLRGARKRKRCDAGNDAALKSNVPSRTPPATAEASARSRAAARPISRT